LLSNFNLYRYTAGGECNYLLEVNEKYDLEFVDHARWREADPVVREMYWFAHDREKVDAFLDRAQTFLTDYSEVGLSKCCVVFY
jgi:IMP and pyridine-specific 5'-nucleotidase